MNVSVTNMENLIFHQNTDKGKMDINNKQSADRGM